MEPSSTRTGRVAHRAMGASDAALFSASPVNPVPAKPVPRANTLYLILFSFMCLTSACVVRPPADTSALPTTD